MKPAMHGPLGSASTNKHEVQCVSSYHLLEQR